MSFSVQPEFALQPQRAWDLLRVQEHLRLAGAAHGLSDAELWMRKQGLVPALLDARTVQDEAGNHPVAAVLQVGLEAARCQGVRIVFAQLLASRQGADIIHLNDANGKRWWWPMPSGDVSTEAVEEALAGLRADVEGPLAIFPHGRLAGVCRGTRAESGWTGFYPPRLLLPGQEFRPIAAARTPHLAQLEAESVHILREAVAESSRAGMLYSIGKDSSVLLHLARKAFHPSPPPFPLLHVDTRWKFQEMYQFRDHIARHSGMQLLVHINPQAVQDNINPFDHGSALHTEITKTEGLRQALELHRFDLVFGGARRDEEKSRAKERIFSFRNAAHQWDPRHQRPEVWNLYNARVRPGESIRVFPLSNWTESDIWHYIYQEGIPVVPLYFARQRPVVERNGTLLVVDDARFRLQTGEQIQMRQVRFRTLGCYPLTGAVASDADTLPKVMMELAQARVSERQGRTIDSDGIGSMEKKKREGYF